MTGTFCASIASAHSRPGRFVARAVSAIAATLIAPYALRSSPDLSATGPSTIPDRDPVQLQALVDDLRTRLSIQDVVTVTVVPVNPRVVSVKAPPDFTQAFRIDIERDFLDTLADDELSAVIAHELGHVWVFTHHPYLQTEQLANEIAMRVVSRDSLDRVYGKSRVRGDATSDHPGVPGP